MAHVIRYAEPETRKPSVDERGRSLYFVECDDCGIVGRGIKSRKTAEVQADRHECPQPEAERQTT